MNETNLNWITDFICGIADDVLRDVWRPRPARRP